MLRENMVTANGTDPEPATQRLEEVASLPAIAVPIRHDLPTAGSPSESAGSPKESPWLARPARPDGAGRAKRGHVPRAPARPSGEPTLALVGLDELRRTVIGMIARRAAVILKEMENGAEGPQA